VLYDAAGNKCSIFYFIITSGGIEGIARSTKIPNSRDD